MRNRLSIALLMWLCALCVSAQGLISFTSDQGLSNTCVHSIFEDSYHNVWVTTRNGLNMYDGAKLRSFFHHEGDSTSLINNQVTSVAELKPGKLLVGTNAGLSLYDYDTDSFRELDLVNERGQKGAPRVVGIVSRKDGSAIVLTVGPTSYVVSCTQDSVRVHFTLDYLMNGKGITRYLEASDGKIWVVNNAHQVGYFLKGKRVPVPIDGNVGFLVEGADRNIYVNVQGKGLYRYEERQHTFVPLPLPQLVSATIKRIRSNGEGCIYVCTDGNGLYLYNEKTGELSQPSARTSEYNLNTANIEDAMQDNEGNLWIGIYWKGIVVQPHQTSVFDYVGRRSSQKNTLGTNCVTSICPDKDNGMWVGTDHCGLYHLSPDGSESVHYKPGEVTHVPSTITAIYQDATGMLWLGSSIGPLVCMNPNTGIFTPFEQIHPQGKEVSKVYGITADKYGTLWMATMGEGLFSYNPSTRQIHHYTGRSANDKPTESNILGNVWINCIAIDGDVIYLGHTSGIHQLRIQADGTLVSMVNYQKMGTFDMAIDAKGLLWAATDQGLCCVKFHPDSVSVEYLTQANGLCNNMVRSVELVNLPNGKYQLWVSTDNGMSCYNPETKLIRNFFMADGLQGNEFTEHCSAIVGNRLAFGGVNGMNIFSPADVNNLTDFSVPNLRVVGLYLQGELVKSGQHSGNYTIYRGWIDGVEELNFSHADHTIAIELGTLNVAKHIVYEYELDGHGWVNLGNGQNRIVLSNLSTGTHQLLARAVTGGKTGEVRSMNIVVHPAWYASTWMKMVYLLLFLCVIYLVYIYVRTSVRARRVLMERRQEEELAEARIQFFMNISHEIRTPMTLILAPLEKLRMMGDDEVHNRHYNLIYQNAQRILQLVNQMLDVRKIEKGQFHLHYQRIEMVGFIKNLFDLFRESAQTRQIQFEFHHTMDRLEVQADTDSMDKILMNLLSNALKFTSDGGYVIIDLQENPEAGVFQINVTDSGVGIGPNKERVFERFYSGVHKNGYIGTGIGLNLTYLLVQLHKGNIRVMDNPKEHGTRFEVELPIGHPEERTLPDEALQTAEAQSLSVEKSNGKRFRNLMLVEDDTDIRKYLLSELSSDFNITEFNNGLQAWEYVQRYPEKVNVILTDVMMPMMGGDELCQKVKANFNTNHIPVIMLSAKNADSDRIAGMSIGADAYLTKPFNVDLLRTTVRTILQNHLSLQNRTLTAQRAEEEIDKVELVSPDEHLMERVMKCVNDNLNNADLSVEFVADAVGVSRVHFHRKIKELTGQTPRDFIRSIRMKQAERLLREKHLDITDVSIATGFKSLSTFSTTFKSIYGMTPSEYMNSKKND